MAAKKILEHSPFYYLIWNSSREVCNHFVSIVGLCVSEVVTLAYFSAPIAGDLAAVHIFALLRYLYHVR